MYARIAALLMHCLRWTVIGRDVREALDMADDNAGMY